MSDTIINVLHTDLHRKHEHLLISYLDEDETEVFEAYYRMPRSQYALIQMGWAALFLACFSGAFGLYMIQANTPDELVSTSEGLALFLIAVAVLICPAGFFTTRYLRHRRIIFTTPLRLAIRADLAWPFKDTKEQLYWSSIQKNDFERGWIDKLLGWIFRQKQGSLLMGTPTQEDTHWHELPRVPHFDKIQATVNKQHRIHHPAPSEVTRSQVVPEVQPATPTDPAPPKPQTYGAPPWATTRRRTGTGPGR